MNIGTKNKENTKNKILQVAVEEFAKHGFDNVSYRDISKKSGTSIALITRYFGGKMGLLAEAVTQMRTEVYKELRFGTEKNSLREECHYLADVYLNIYANNKESLAAMFSIIKTDSELMRLATENPEKYTYESERFQKYYETGDIHESRTLQSISDELLMLVQSVTYFTFIMFDMPIEQVRKLVHKYVDDFTDGLGKNEYSRDVHSALSR